MLKLKDFILHITAWETHYKVFSYGGPVYYDGTVTFADEDERHRKEGELMGTYGEALVSTITAFGDVLYVNAILPPQA